VAAYRVGMSPEVRCGGLDRLGLASWDLGGDFSTCLSVCGPKQTSTWEFFPRLSAKLGAQAASQLFPRAHWVGGPVG
jgi:hypothetical protein